MITIENWAVIQMGDEHSSPERMSLHFKGFAYGHPRFENGHPIVTTRIVGYKEGVFMTLSGSQYLLGKVDKNYEKFFPNALERVLESASKMEEFICDVGGQWSWWDQ